MKFYSGWVEGGIFIVKLKEVVNENSNKYFVSIVLETLRIGLTSAFVGSEG